jgi:hypothetical protein
MHTTTYTSSPKQKKQSATVDHTHSVAKALWTNISTVLMRVSVPVENGSNNHQPSHMPLED